MELEGVAPLSLHYDTTAAAHLSLSKCRCGSVVTDMGTAVSKVVCYSVAQWIISTIQRNIDLVHSCVCVCVCARVCEWFVCPLLSR